MWRRRAAAIVLSLAMSASGCGRDTVAPLTPAAPTPIPVQPPAGPTVTLTGQVTDRAGNPINANVGAYPLNSSPAWFGFTRFTQADASGHYRLASLPEHADTVFVKAWKEGHVQQCATTVRLETDTRVDLTITSKTDVLLGGLPTAPQTRHVSGTVYQVRDNERRPAPDVWVGWEPIMDTVVADTFTDALGRYRICGVSRDRIIGLFAVRIVIGPPRPAYAEVESGGDAVIDLELP